MKFFERFRKKSQNHLAMTAVVLFMAFMILLVTNTEPPKVNWNSFMAGSESTLIADGLTMDKSQFVRLVDGMEPIFLEEEKPVFKRGERVTFAFFNVGKFKKGEDGLHWFEMDIEITGPDGEIVLTDEETMGGQGHMELENDIATTPNGVFIGGSGLEEGDYNIQLTIYDKIGGGFIAKTSTFVLETAEPLEVESADLSDTPEPVENEVRNALETTVTVTE